MLFVASIDPLLRKLQITAAIRGFPLPGGDTVAASAYADNDVLFLRDPCRVNEALKVFSLYASVSGAQRNASKSRAMLLCDFPTPLPGCLPIAQHIEVLGVVYDHGGVASSNWPVLVKHLEQRIGVATQFQLS